MVTHLLEIISLAEAYSEPCKTSEMELFANIINSFNV